MKLTAKKALTMSDVYAHDKVFRLIKDRCKEGFKNLYQDNLDATVRKTLIQQGYEVEQCYKGWVIKWSVIVMNRGEL